MRKVAQVDDGLLLGKRGREVERLLPAEMLLVLVLVLLVLVLLVRIVLLVLFPPTSSISYTLLSTLSLISSNFLKLSLFVPEHSRAFENVS